MNFLNANAIKTDAMKKGVLDLTRVQELIDSFNTQFGNAYNELLNEIVQKPNKKPMRNKAPKTDVKKESAPHTEDKPKQPPEMRVVEGFHLYHQWKVISNKDGSFTIKVAEKGRGHLVWKYLQLTTPSEQAIQAFNEYVDANLKNCKFTHPVKVDDKTVSELNTELSSVGFTLSTKDTDSQQPATDTSTSPEEQTQSETKE